MYIFIQNQVSLRSMIKWNKADQVYISMKILENLFNKTSSYRNKIECFVWYYDQFNDCNM